MSVQNWIKALPGIQDTSLRGCVVGLKRERGRIVDSMRGTKAHGVVTGATKTSYTVAVVGMGETGAAEAALAFAAVEELNPGHVGRSSITIDAAVGVLLYSGTTYQPDLETGGKAVLEPTLQTEHQALTAVAAAGSTRALGG